MRPPFFVYAYIAFIVIVLCSCVLWLGVFFDHQTPSSGLEVVPTAHAQKIAQNSVNTASAKPLTLLAVGDIMLGRNVETLINEHGSAYPFAFVHDLLASSTIVMANLEGPIVADHVQTPDMGFQFSFSPSIAPLLAEEHVTTVSLANNHTFNYGATGLSYTRSVLSQNNVVSFGDPNTFGNQYAVRENINGQSIVFAGLNTTDPNFDSAGALNFIKNLPRQAGDFLIVMPHGGTEYSGHSNQFQETFYRSLIDAGADVVIGAHPHVVEEIEEYKNHLIFYSLGNFIFDQYFSIATQQELAVNLIISSGSIRYDFLPLISVESQPTLMNTESKNEWLNSLASTSSLVIQDEIRQGSITLIRSH